MEQYTENQYDDDLTIGNEEYDDSYYTGAEDLFAVSPDEESPISRLKSLILSIDWEITDEVLLLFNEELVSLRDTWAGDKINLIYVQALEKISKYIYYKKADSHPSAIKLLLTLYHNLEKIVTSENWSEDQKKELLFEDVKRYEQLKVHIKKDGLTAAVEDRFGEVVQNEPTQSGEELRNLKAIVLGIDWEITDEDLNALREEVVKLEGMYAGNKPRLILLQGIGTLGAYIKLRKSDAHAEAFKVLHLFCSSLEKIVESPLSLQEEKEILFPAVEKFNSFKTLIGSTITPDAIAKKQGEIKESTADTVQSPAGGITPAFADIPEDEVKGFQPDEEAHALGYESPEDVVSHVADFFPDETGDAEEAIVSDEPAGILVDSVDEMSVVDPEVALQGVNVEEDDDDDEIALTGEDPAGTTPPVAALQDFESEQTEIAVEEAVIDPVAAVEVAEPDTEQTHEDVANLDLSTETPEVESIDAETALQGVDVETEADDDSDEEGLPKIDGELAPALSAEPIIGETDLEDEKVDEDPDAEEDIEGVLANFFGEEEVEAPGIAAQEFDESLDEISLEADEPTLSPPTTPAEEMAEAAFGEEAAPISVDRETALAGVDVDAEGDDETDESPLPALGDEVAPALSFDDEYTEETTIESVVLPEIEQEEVQVVDTIDEFFNDELEEFDTPTIVAEALEAEPDEVVFTEEPENDDQDISEFVERLDNFFGDDEAIDDAALHAALAPDLGVETEAPIAALSELNDTEDSFDPFEEEVIFELAEDFDYLDINDIEPLQLNVDSLGNGNDEAVLKALSASIEALNQKCADRPLELSVLTLVSSIAEKYSSLSGNSK